MVYVILGETASGKSQASLSICKAAGLPLISADAFSVYRGFDIGSAKPTPAELNGVEHYFISTHRFGDPMTVFEFQTEGRKLLDAFQAQGRDVVISGGTFLYVRALLFPYDFPKDEKPVISHSGMSLEAMRAKLLALDPSAQKSVDFKNPRRVERALAMAEQGFTRSQAVAAFSNVPLYPCVFLRIAGDRDGLNRRIEARVQSMVDQGLFEEVHRLASENPEYAKVFKGIGFREVIEGEAKGWSKALIQERIVVDTRQYAKRQRTFLRHQFPFMIEAKGSEMPALVLADIRKRRSAMEQTQTKKLPGEGLIPLIGEMSLAYLPAIDELYDQGVRAIGVYMTDPALSEDFVYKIHLNAPLMAVCLFTPLDFDNPKLPAFSFVLPLPPLTKGGDKIREFIRKKKIRTQVPAELSIETLSDAIFWDLDGKEAKHGKKQ